MLAISVSVLVFTAIHLVSNGGQQNTLECFLYLAAPFGFALLAIGLMLATRSFWASVGVHGGFHFGNAAASILLSQVAPPVVWLSVGGVQAAIGLVFIVVSLRRGRAIP